MLLEVSGPVALASWRRVLRLLRLVAQTEAGTDA